MTAPVQAPGSRPVGATPSRPIVDGPRPRSAWRAFAGSFRYAWYGIVETALRQRNMRIHLVAALWVGVLGSTVSLGTADSLALLLCVFLVISAEVANSALEALVDLVTRERNELARLAKDAGAGAVLVLAVASVAVLALVLIRVAPGIQDVRALSTAGALALGVSVAMAGLLTEWRRAPVVDVLLAVAGAILLVPVALGSRSAVFTGVAVLALAVATAVAVARRRGQRS